jgi:NitT/TauT family transport system permease protein
VVIVFWLGVWQLIALAAGSPIIVATPVQTATALVHLVGTAGFWGPLLASLGRIALGLVAGAVAGAALGALPWPWAQALVEPIVRVARAVPVVSFVIVILLWWGPDQLTVVVAALMTAPVIFAAVREGLAARSPALTEVARIYGAGRADFFREVTWPAVVPFLRAAGQVSVGLAWKAGVSAEVIGLPAHSIGERMYQARLTLATADVLAWTVTLVALAWAGERAVAILLRRV